MQPKSIPFKAYLKDLPELCLEDQMISNLSEQLYTESQSALEFSDLEFIKKAFEDVRDEIAHS